MTPGLGLAATQSVATHLVLWLAVGGTPLLAQGDWGASNPLLPRWQPRLPGDARAQEGEEISFPDARAPQGSPEPVTKPTFSAEG